MNKLCCELNHYATCAHCKAKSCRECLKNPQDPCVKGLVNRLHRWQGGSILRSMPLRIK